jgi:hypothetical protein
VAEQWASNPLPIYHFSDYYAIDLVRDTVVTSSSGVYQVLDLYAETLTVTPTGIVPGPYFPVVLIVDQAGDFGHNLVDPLIPTSTSPPVSYYPQ